MLQKFILEACTEPVACFRNFAGTPLLHLGKKPVILFYFERLVHVVRAEQSIQSVLSLIVGALPCTERRSADVRETLTSRAWYLVVSLFFVKVSTASTYSTT